MRKRRACLQKSGVPAFEGVLADEKGVFALENGVLALEKGVSA